MKVLLLALVLVLPSFVSAQLTKKDSTWLILKPFIGHWKGQGGGQPGQGSYERSYQFVLNKNFIEIKNKSKYPAKTKKDKPEIHEDRGFISYDKAQKKFKMRQFHIESFVNEYSLDSISADRKTLVFVTEAIENIPKGFVARETYTIVSENEIIEIFEIAEPNKPFEMYSKVTLFRKK